MFQSPEPEKSMKIPEEEKNKAQMLRETIIRTMNEASEVIFNNSIVTKILLSILWFSVNVEIVRELA